MAEGVRRHLSGRIYFVGTTSAAAGISAQDEGTGEPGSDTYGTDWTTPFATFAYAKARCVAGRGDTIYILPGTTIDITAAAGLDIDVTGLSVIGLGTPGNRPTITCSGTDDNTDIDIDAAGVTLENIAFDMTGNDSVAAFIDVNAANCTFRNCYFLLADSGGQVDIGVDVGGANCRFFDCEFYGDTAASTAVSVSIAGVGPKFYRCWIDLVGSTGAGGLCCIDFTAAAVNFYAEDCSFANRVASATATVDCNANAVTGMMVRCNHTLGTIASAGSGIVPVVSDTPEAYVALIENYVVNDQGGAGHAGEAGALVGAASS